jgi:hypothetical protein
MDKMKNRTFLYLKNTLVTVTIMLLIYGCEREVSDQVEFANFPNTGEVFIDGFSGGLEYFPFDGSKLDAFTVDTDVKYSGEASMRFDVPNVGDPSGSFAGAIFPDYGGRDLSGYDALTFWAKATKAAFINEIGFGNDFGENKFLVTKRNLRIDTGWKKYVIPIPDPSKLWGENGMFWYSEGPENGDGYTFWIDDLKFEKLGTVAQPQPAIFNGQDLEAESFLGIQGLIPRDGLTQTFNLSNGANQTVVAAPSYFSFISSDVDVVRVNELGVITPFSVGTATITATLGGVKARGSAKLEVRGAFEIAPAPPERNPEDVISIFSDSYTNVPVDFYNGFFDGQTTLGGSIRINEDNSIIFYENLNFVATSFSNPTVNGSQKTHFHVDIRIDENIDPGDTIRFELIDFGPDGAFGGGDDTGGAITYASGQLESSTWISFDIPFTDFKDITGGGLGGLANGDRANLAQIVFASGGISTLFVDNMYFYSE